MQSYKINYTNPTPAESFESDQSDLAYESLGTVLNQAYDQAAKGKGKERHAVAGEPFEDQQICEITRRLGLGYPLGQAVKKIYEAERMYQEATDGERRAVAELLGAINYIAAAVVVIQETPYAMEEPNS